MQPDFEDEFAKDESEAELPLPQTVPAKIVPKKSKLDISQPSDDGDNIWLISYADLMTLIACFFILLVAFANFDPVSFSRKAVEMAKHFSGDKPNDPNALGEQLQRELIDDPVLKGNAKVMMQMDGVEIKFSGSALFEPGKADLKPEVQDALDILIDMIYEKNPNAKIIVEGHTDDTPMMNSSKYSSNWELSSARSSRVIERFQQFGFNPLNLVAVGYGSTRPIKPHYDQDGKLIVEHMQENRRVIIKVLDNPELLKRQKIGLGVYFDDKLIEDKK
jgi:chemotaxis protein MotB